MQIHELNSFVGTPSNSDYLAIDDGATTTKVPATSLGVSTAMTQAEAEAGNITDLRVISPSVFKSAVLAIAKTIADIWLPQSVVHIVEAGTSGDWTYRKWSDGRTEAWASYSFDSASWSTWGSPVRYMDKTLNFPSGLFSSAPTMITSSASNQYWVVNAYASSATQGTMRIASLTQNDMATTARIYAWTN